MRRIGWKSGVAVVAAAGLLAVAGCGGATDKAGGTKPADAIVLTVLNSRDAVDMQPWADKVAALSHGALRLTGGEKWHDHSLTAEADAIREVRAGHTDLAIIPARAWHDAGVTSFDALIAPLTVDSLAAQEKVLASDLPAQMLAGVAPLGLTGIGVMPGPMRNPAGITRAMRSPVDYRGTRIGYYRSPVADRALRAIGATPVATTFDGDDVTGFDAIELQVDGVAGNEYDSVVRTVTANVNLWSRPLVVVGNTTALRRLTGPQVGWLRTAVGDVLGGGVQTLLRRQADGTAILCRRAKLTFVRATPDEVAQLRGAFQPVYAWLRQDAQTARFLDRVAALQAGTQPFPQESPPSCPAAPGSASAVPATPLDGTYRTDVSEEVWRKTDPERHPENWGTFVYVLDRGRFAATQENPVACTWAYGTYVVDGSRLDLAFLDGGGIAPTNAQNKPGEEFSFHWSRYKGTVTFTTIEPADLHWTPWHQVGAQPSASALSKRCPPPARARAG